MSADEATRCLFDQRGLVVHFAKDLDSTTRCAAGNQKRKFRSGRRDIVKRVTLHRAQLRNEGILARFEIGFSAGELAQASTPAESTKTHRCH